MTFFNINTPAGRKAADDLMKKQGHTNIMPSTNMPRGVAPPKPAPKPASKLISKPKLSSFKGIGQKLSASRMAKGGAVGSKLSPFRGIGQKLSAARSKPAPALIAKTAANAQEQLRRQREMQNLQQTTGATGRPAQTGSMAKGGAVGSKTKAKRK
jgi:hypothetical protein